MNSKYDHQAHPEIADPREGQVWVGVDIGGTKTAVVLSAQVPHVLWRKEFATEPDAGPDHALQQIRHLIASALQETATTPRAIGVSCGGPLDRVSGVIQSPPNLPTWDNIPITSMLEKAFSVPCYLENDANAGALAEHRFGAGRGCNHIIFLTMGTGLGAGLVLNGRLFHGATAMAGEIGHVRLTEHGPEGYNKSGSVEGWASGGGMARHASEVIQGAASAGRSTLLSPMQAAVSARDVGNAFAAGDTVATEIVRRTGVRLGEALAILVDLINPERIVIGGLALRFGEALLQPARIRMHEEALAASANACTVLPAALGESIGDIAALCVAMGLHH